MVIRNILNRTRHLAQEVAHFGHLGKVAAHRYFLLKERRKLLLKIGEKAVRVVKKGNIKSPDLERLVRHVEKLDALLKEKDY